MNRKNLRDYPVSFCYVTHWQRFTHLAGQELPSYLSLWYYSYTSQRRKWDKKASVPRAHTLRKIFERCKHRGESKEGEWDQLHPAGEGPEVEPKKLEKLWQRGHWWRRRRRRNKGGMGQRSFKEEGKLFLSSASLQTLKYSNLWGDEISTREKTDWNQNKFGLQVNL